MQITPDVADMVLHRTRLAYEDENGAMSEGAGKDFTQIVLRFVQLIQDIFPEDFTEDQLKTESHYVWKAASEYLFQAVRLHPGNDEYSDDEIRRGLKIADVAEVAERVEFMAEEVLMVRELLRVADGGVAWDPDDELKTLLGD